MPENYSYSEIDNFYYPKNQPEFSYKDSGNSEERLYEKVRNSTDKSLFSNEIVSGAYDWASLYHSTPLRANILRPFSNLIAKGRTLELGAGCGAITRFIGELGGDVVALEGSKNRARIIGNRCSDLKNVKVIADLIQNYQPDDKFDTVTLIGVLEYAQVYIDKPNPIQELLRISKSFLKKNGTLILAIENKLGLKYLCGSPEDHLGRPMYGINNSYTKNSPITFGRKELEDHIQEAGFKSIQLYTPLPDYKTPVSIVYPNGFSDESRAAGWDIGPIFSGSVVHDRQRPTAPTFSLENAWQVVSRNNLSQDLSNSFLYEIKIDDCPPSSNILAAHYGSQRPKQFAKETIFLMENGGVITKTRTISDTANLDSSPWEISPYRTGTLWFDQLLIEINRPNWTLENLGKWAEVWINALRLIPAAQSNSAIPELRHFEHLLPSHYIDATPTNLVIGSTGRGSFFDLEWNFSTSIPLEFVVFRGLFLTLHRVTSCARPASSVPEKIFDICIILMQQHNIIINSDDMELFITLFNAFQNQTQDLPNNALNSLTAQLESAKLPIRQLFT